MLGLRRNPRAAPPGARPGHLQAQQDGIREFGVCGIMELFSLGTRPCFHRTGRLSSPPRVGLTHPCHTHQLPPALPSWDQSSEGTGRSPQDAALCCGHWSWAVPNPQERGGHPGGAARGAPGSAQPGQGPANPSGDELLGDLSIPPPSPRGSPQPRPPWGSQQGPPLTWRGEQPSDSGGKMRRRLLGVTLR